MNDADLSRFWQKVHKAGECLEFRGSPTAGGYGRFGFQGRVHSAHRLAWEIEHGPIPNGLEIDHKCHNPKCVNLEHLRLATRKQNGENRPRLSNNKSGYRGVSWHKTSGKWRASVRHNSNLIFLGYFDDAHEAGAVAKAKRNELFTFNDADRGAA